MRVFNTLDAVPCGDVPAGLLPAGRRLQNLRSGWGLRTRPEIPGMNRVVRPRPVGSQPALKRLMLVAITLAPLAAGCSSLGRPDWLAPGPARNQQRRAVRFDPYMQDDVGPYLLRLPLVDGGRPRDYAEPVPEVRRARWWAAGR